jgi:hypothetical protein
MSHRCVGKSSSQNLYSSWGKVQDLQKKFYGSASTLDGTKDALVLQFALNKDSQVNAKSSHNLQNVIARTALQESGMLSPSGHI